jgi:hypothetical protein
MEAPLRARPPAFPRAAASFNILQETKHWTHWSRTVAVHGGIGVLLLATLVINP